MWRGLVSVWAGGLIAALPLACSGRPSEMPPVERAEQYIEPAGSSGRSVRLRPAVCEGLDLRPEYGSLNEANLVRFLEQQQYAVQVQHQQVDPKQPPLTFVFVVVPGAAPVPLRVAILPNGDDAAQALYDALLKRGPGVWGFHRSNLSVLGPVGTKSEDIAFAAKTKLACWGAVTLAEGDEVLALAGGYAEP